MRNAISHVLEYIRSLFGKVRGYKPLSETRHSELRATKNLTQIDVETFGITDRSTLDVRVGYTFTRRKRKNVLANGKKYSSTETFIEIYHHLVRLNKGEPFIERYFDTLFKSKFESEVRRRTRLLLSKIDKEYEDILAAQKKTKKGAYNKRTRAYKKLESFNAWKDAQVNAEFDSLSMLIKKHIKYCLAVGKIPLNFFFKQSTIKAREKLGLTPVTAFFATGQLIDNLIISYEADWRAS